MSEILEFNKRTRVRSEASLWLTRMVEGLGTEQQQELAAWLGSDPTHETELLELATIWDELEVLTELAPLFEGIPLPLTKNIANEQPASSNLYWLPLSAAISLLIAFGLGAYLFDGGFNSTLFRLNDTASDSKSHLLSKPKLVGKDNTVKLFKTAIGEQLEVTLTDGSIATLNTDTKIETNFSKHQRIIRLLQGEAHFDVFKDSTRPLKVLVSGKSVQAVGTAFSVRKKSDTDIEVAVEEGLVAVYQIKTSLKNDNEHEQTVSLEAGDVLTIADEQAQLIEYDLDEMEDRLAWRKGMIIINDKTLDYVINEFDRHSEQKVLLADRKMGEIRVAGYFRLGDVDALLVALEQNFKIHSEYYQNNNTYVLSQLSLPFSDQPHRDK